MAKYTNAELIVPATQKGSGLEQAFQLFPSRCIDVGIAEEHALTLAGAMALNGIHPIVAIYSTFLQRAYDELSHDCSRFNVDMTILIDRAGLVGSNGETHQGIYDEAYLKSIPNIVVTMPASQAEAKALYYQSFERHGNDPTFHGTDHTREKIPLLIYSPSITNGTYLEERDSFADMGESILVNFGLKKDDTMIGKVIKELYK